MNRREKNIWKILHTDVFEAHTIKHSSSVIQRLFSGGYKSIYSSWKMSNGVDLHLGCVIWKRYSDAFIRPIRGENDKFELPLKWYGSFHAHTHTPIYTEIPGSRHRDTSSYHQREYKNTEQFDIDSKIANPKCVVISCFSRILIEKLTLDNIYQTGQTDQCWMEWWRRESERERERTALGSNTWAPTIDRAKKRASNDMRVVGKFSGIINCCQRFVNIQSTVWARECYRERCFLHACAL